MREGPIICWRGDFVMGRPWFEVLVVFGVLGEFNMFAGGSPDVVDVRPPAEGDDSVRPEPRSRVSIWAPRVPGCGRSRPPRPSNDVDVFGGPFRYGTAAFVRRSPSAPDRGAVTLDQQPGRGLRQLHGSTVW